MVKQFGHNNVAALNHANALFLFGFNPVFKKLGTPWARRIDDRPCTDGAFAIFITDDHFPKITVTFGRHTFGTGFDFRPQIAGRHRVEHDKTRVLYPAIGINKCLIHALDQRFTRRVIFKFDAFGARKLFASAKMVIQKQTKADHPCRTQAFDMGQNKTQWPNDVRGCTQQNFTFDQRFADQTEFVMLKIAQAAMDQLGAGRRGGAGKVVLFTQKDLKPTPRSVPCDACAIDTTANDGDVVCF